MEKNELSLNDKLLEIQKRIGAITKDSTNPFFKSKYFDINKLLSCVKPVLSDIGVILLQPLSMANGVATIKTILRDVISGDEVISETIIPNNPDPQKMGTVITYFRRYSLQSLLALEAEDDDGNAGSGNKVEPKTYQKPEPKRYSNPEPVNNYNANPAKKELSEYVVGKFPEDVIKSEIDAFSDQIKNIKSEKDYNAIKAMLESRMADNIIKYRKSVIKGLKHLADKEVDSFNNEKRKEKSILKHLGASGLNSENLNDLYKYYKHLLGKVGK